ncbi:hypothetical protein SNE40_002082 [Patella caerulea]|uniref:Uncharacterized protein n=1 Tax=Patella caerulea TaxID=87958 RepID=A0AAN8KBK4_PATCE
MESPLSTIVIAQQMLIYFYLFTEISTRTIPAKHQYQEVAMQQLPTERTTLNSNRTLLRHREALITPSTQTSSDYERPVPLLLHRLSDYGEDFVSGDDAAASGEDVVSGDDAASDGLDDTNSTSLFTPQNGDQTSPKYIDTESRSLSYTRLDRQTMNQRPNYYQELNVQVKDNK